MKLLEARPAAEYVVAERIRRRIASEPFPIQRGARSLEVTISIGIASIAPSALAATGW